MLLRTLREFLENKDVKDSVSFQAAIILSNCTHFEQLYEERLRRALTDGSPHQQSLVSSYERIEQGIWILFATITQLSSYEYRFNFISLPIKDHVDA